MSVDANRIVAKFEQSLADRHLSRNERRSLGELFATLDGDEERDEVRRLAFATARARLLSPQDQDLLDWLEDAVKTLHRPPDSQAARSARVEDLAEAWFSPADDCTHRIIQLIANARTSVDICVFTVTDDRIAGAILDAHRRGLALRIATDDAKQDDLGSDIDRLRSAGVPVRTDRSEFHMHHKFALFDGTHLLTGSYNWTRGAARDNQENFVITGDPRLVAAFARTFERLWTRLS